MRPGPRLVVAAVAAAAAGAAAATAAVVAVATAVVAVAAAVADGKPQTPPKAALKQQSHAGRVHEVLPVFL
jgi:predicted house-cleaning NTP pyrophosphatase (Maf/HAM1 superfamily)